MTVFGSIFLILGASILLIGILAWTKHLPGNRYIGIKVPEVRISQHQWNIAHQFAGPVWVASGISTIIAALLIIGGEGWFRILALIPLLLALYFYGLGGSLATRAAGIMNTSSESNNDSCCSSTDTEDTPDVSIPPAIDFAALRRAAKQADQ